jgi:CubicO group peptidase (beta-lactamase class C family)
MKRFAVSILIVFAVSVSLIVRGGEFPSTTPEDVGMSSERLGRIDDYVERHLDQIVQFKAYGMQDIEAHVPMSTDSIFRIYSMSKPITSVAVMMLFEEGHFLLNDPVSNFLPEFKDLEVGVEEVDEATGEKVLKTVPANRQVTIRDLLRHTSGLTYFWGPSMVDEIYREKGVLTEDETIQDTVVKLGTIPLMHQPGTIWHYGVSTDVLGRLVEVVSGQPYDDFLEQRIFKPLGMKDTGFYVPAEKVDRLTSVYTPNEDNTAISPQDPEKAQDFTDKTNFFSGGGGLVSTAADYLRFAQMLLNEGELDGARILGLETVQLMTRNHLGKIPAWGGVGNYGFGLGFLVNPDRGDAGSILSKGTFGWGGMAHTTFWVDPEEDLVGIFLIQVFPRPPIAYRDLFKPVVYQAIVD